MSATTTAVKRGQLFTLAGVVAACVGFVLIGGLQALYGPAIPALREKYDLRAAAGLALSVHFVGGLAGVLLFHRAYGRVGNRTLLGVSFLAMLIGLAASPSWPLALGGAWVAGLGFGGVDYGLNHLFALGFGARGSAMLNILNGHFGIGSVLAPILLGVVGQGRDQLVFLGFAVVAGCLLFALTGVRDQHRDQDSPDGARVDVRRRSVVMLLALVVLYVLNIGVESGIGGWEPTHLEAIGHPVGTAAAVTAPSAGSWSCR